MDDTLTIVFALCDGMTPNGQRNNVKPATPLWTQTIDVEFNPSLEDMGVGALLDDPRVVAVSTSWVDDYDDTHRPLLRLTAIHYDVRTDSTAADSTPASQINAHAVQVPHFERGTQIVEWIVAYMQNNVYHQTHKDDH